MSGVAAADADAAAADAAGTLTGTLAFGGGLNTGRCVSPAFDWGHGQVTGVPRPACPSGSAGCGSAGVPMTDCILTVAEVG